MTIGDIHNRLERLHPDLPSQVRVSTVVESDGATHPHAQCPRVYDGYDTLVPTRGNHESLPFSRLTSPLACRYCENSLMTPAVLAFYAEQFESVLKASTLLERLSAPEVVPELDIIGVLATLTPSIAVPQRAIVLALHALTDALPLTAAPQGTLLYVYRGEKAALDNLKDAVAHFANGYSLLLIESVDAVSIISTSGTLLKTIVVAPWATLEEARIVAQSIEALLATGLTPEAACEAAYSLATV